MLTIEHFKSFANTPFKLELNEAELEAELIKVTPLKQHLPDLIRVPFSLLFEVHSETLPIQGNYRVKHDTMNDSTLFLVPVQSRNNGKHFLEAVFN